MLYFIPTWAQDSNKTPDLSEVEQVEESVLANKSQKTEGR